MSGVDTGVDIRVTGQADVSSLLSDVLANFAGLYTDKWFLASILVAFFFGQLTHALLRAHAPRMRDINKASIIWAIQLVVGYSAAFKLMDGSAEADKFAWLTGIHSITIYYVLLWIAVRWMKAPLLAKFLSLRETTVNEKGDIDFGATIKFIRGKDE